MFADTALAENAHAQKAHAEELTSARCANSCGEVTDFFRLCLAGLEAPAAGLFLL